jgi:hypothetical protein
MKLALRVLGLVLLTSAVTVAQEPKQNSPSLARTVVLDIDVLDVNLDQRADIERIVKDKRSLDRFIAEGKARPMASVQMRARNGEQATARMGQRVPVQASTTAQGTPQIQYENTGLSVDVEPRLVESDRIAIKLKVELTAVVRNENILAPTFVQRTVTDFVNVRPGEPVVLINVTQHEGLLPASSKPGSKPGEQAGVNFVIVLTARLLD